MGSARDAMHALRDAAAELAQRLAQRRRRIVLAESCTAGLAAAALAGVPGISEWLVGSLVVYRESAKQAWLGVSARTLAQHSAVSGETAVAMARGALRRTAEAHLAVAITGHLGPDAPRELDGVVYLAACRRQGKTLQMLGTAQVHLRAHARHARQVEAALHLLQVAAELVPPAGR